MFATYYQAVAELEATISTESASYMGTSRPLDFFLKRTQYLFDQLGNPEKGFTIVHVTGTSGKGSTACMIYEILRAAGKSVGLYMSPYVTTPAENIQANGLLISPEDFALHVQSILPVVKEIAQHNPELQPSYAEIFFAAAMRYYHSVNIEWLVLEVGCGGRYDKTNIIPDPVASVITNIGIDHTQVLGETLEEIAYHKVGIIRKAVPVFSAEQNSAMRTIIESEVQRQETTIQYCTPSRAYLTAMPGVHQQQNASIADAVGHYLGISPTDINNGIAAAHIPARVETVQKYPHVIIDGAHSEPKIRSLIHTILDNYTWDQLHLLVSFKEGKDTSTLAQLLSKHASTVTVTSFQLPGFGSTPLSTVQKQFQDACQNVPIYTIADPKEALRSVLDLAQKDDLVLITGSLYLAGIVREEWYPEQSILEQRSVYPELNTIKAL